MQIRFALKQFFREKDKNAHLNEHFLLEPARLFVQLTFSDSSQLRLPLAELDASGKVDIEIGVDQVPNAPGATHKLTITQLLMDFFVDFPRDGKIFRLLRIIQVFKMKPGKANSDTNVDYDLSPFGWAHAKRFDRRMSNASVHPLIDVSKLKLNVIGINALVVDLTDLWDHLHRKNKYTRFYKELTDAKKVTFKVFAHLGGNAFIWYGIVPAYASTSSTISPHVFYSPSDWASKQNDKDEDTYLFDNPQQTEAKDGSDEAFNGKILFLSYLLPPVDDTRIPTLNPTLFNDKAWFITWVKTTRRNVVYFKYADDKKTKISLKHFRLGAGFERAYYGLGKVQPQQILLMPQVTGDEGLHADKGSESSAHLTNVTDAIFDLLQTNTDLLIAAKKDELIKKDKLILSCFSESGNDLWKASAIHSDRIKAIIGIEPNNTNPTGANIIPTLLKKKAKVFLIGHVGPGQFYRPKLAAALLKQIRLLPDQPKVLTYPPDPSVNDFVKYRTARVTSATLDPYMSDEEKSLLHDLAARKPPKTGKDAIPEVFTEAANSYKLGSGGVVEIFYTHHFALTGGQEMTLADPNDFYKKPVSYRTFFQQAVEEIG